MEGFVILIIDDHADTATVLARLLKKYGRDAVAVDSGQAAVETLKTLQPTLIVLDMMMPGMHGLEVLRHVRSTATLKDVPVIVFSADYSQETAQKAREGGAQEFMVKGTVAWNHLCQVIIKYAAA
jgi:CheY-like chemotaxis protein